MEGNLRYLERWSHGCDEHPCMGCGVDCLCREALLDQSDLQKDKQS